MSMLRLLLCLSGLLMLTGCMTQEEQQSRNNHLEMQYRKMGQTVDPRLVAACDSYVNKQLQNRPGWVRKTDYRFAYLTNSFLYDYRDQITRRVGSDSSNILIVAARYEGKNGFGADAHAYYYCALNVGDRSISVHGAYSQPTFTNYWGLKPKVPNEFCKDHAAGFCSDSIF